ncbi:MAG: hypothetical protein HYY13_09085 [Nitrospirae bacterium]|nr:hypothetical protein [Nitrospirota bacterium]
MGTRISNDSSSLPVRAGFDPALATLQRALTRLTSEMRAAETDPDDQDEGPVTRIGLGTLGELRRALGSAGENESGEANRSAAEADILDVDRAGATAARIQRSILADAGMAFVSQANLPSDSILTVLG